MHSFYHSFLDGGEAEYPAPVSTKAAFPSMGLFISALPMFWSGNKSSKLKKKKKIKVDNNHVREYLRHSHSCRRH